ncbi:U4/U6-U5 snRNP complex subunit lsm6 [Ophidiomyces ophidiicola]|nr:U4/U6-U5 snRNP complex subunit lsm6 [Ophidiomyces ophidiicola]KAI1967304.1 U4/U6-U5 snRNP complex subunit lsm6 [Ophidiomyces ophidiicola]KAI1995507.1 U4/U6-U5 snRNP complex subunit lsm6 [Ophidiomyces ophidiicola]KAI2031192.1 U4/U6-U5 snRNP complex subunit lsm6 [Ophidiomyces ophidiicola]KAI2055012.1 U4/U6-U5 snRNP complex subunit lsm6 [Ophidiomyces ophidiicola]
MESTVAAEGQDPSAFLSAITGASVTVKLNSGVVYKGTFQLDAAKHADMIFDSNTRSQGELQSIDGYMNIALEKTTEHVNGKLRKSYGDVFVRGNNVLYISAD